MEMRLIVQYTITIDETTKRKCIAKSEITEMKICVCVCPWLSVTADVNGILIRVVTFTKRVKNKRKPWSREAVVICVSVASSDRSFFHCHFDCPFHCHSYVILWCSKQNEKYFTRNIIFDSFLQPFATSLTFSVCGTHLIVLLKWWIIFITFCTRIWADAKIWFQSSYVRDHFERLTQLIPFDSPTRNGLTCRNLRGMLANSIKQTEPKPNAIFCVAWNETVNLLFVGIRIALLFYNPHSHTYQVGIIRIMMFSTNKSCNLRSKIDENRIVIITF